MRITLDIEEEDIERLVKALDNQYAYTRTRNFEDSAYKRLGDLFRQYLKRGPGQAGKSSLWTEPKKCYTELRGRIH